MTRESRALELEEGVFTWSDPKRIASSLRRSAEASTTRKATPFASAMSMLNFFVNRAGKALPAKRRRILDRAKEELRRAYGRAAPRRRGQPAARSNRRTRHRRSPGRTRAAGGSARGDPGGGRRQGAPAHGR